MPEINGAQSSWNACDYLPKGEPAAWFFFEPSAIAVRSPELFLEPEDLAHAHRGFGEVFDRIADSFVAVSSLDTPSESFCECEKKSFPAGSIAEVAAISDESAIGGDRFESETKSRERFAERLAKWGKRASTF